MRPKTIRGWNIDEGAVAGHWASLTLALLGCGFFFPVLHQSRLLTSNKLLQGSPGSRLRRTLSHPVWLACSYLPKWAPQKKEEAPSWFSHCKSGWAESACCTFSSSFSASYLISLSLFFFSPTLSVSFFSLPPLDQCPLCHQEMYKPSLSTPPRCVSPGAPRALSLSMESTRDIRWARRRSVSWCTLVVGGRRARSRYKSHSDFSSDGMCFSVVFKHVSSFLCHFWLRGRS